MAVIKREGILLRATDLYFENGGVFNPAVYQDGETIHLFYRGIQNGGVSMIGYCRLDGPKSIAYRSSQPVIVPEFFYEAFGVEDPRIVKIDDVWYLTYTAFDGAYALGSLAISHDLKSFIKKGIIVPRLSYDQFLTLARRENVPESYFSYSDSTLWVKNVVFFPRPINGKLYFLHRIRPGILIAAIDDLSQLNESFWRHYLEDFSRHILMNPLYPHESIYIGGGCPPIETKKGWLLIYHGTGYERGHLVYSACAALLDLEDPNKVIARLPYALYGPRELWERWGTVNNVVFPSGTALFGNRLYIYYGCADTCIGIASIDLEELLQELRDHPVNDS
jgi:predicted GH43/DUF377 family glycosyl hydrolase